MSTIQILSNIPNFKVSVRSDWYRSKQQDQCLRLVVREMAT